MRKFAAAAVLLVLSVGFVMADEFVARISKVDGNNVTFTRFKKGEKGEAETLPAAADVKVVRGKRGEGKKIEAGDEIKGGLKSEIFAKGAFARITTDADNKKITQIVVFEGKKGGKKGKKKIE